MKIKYFILKPKGTSLYAYASREAMRAFSNCIKDDNSTLGKDLWEWAEDEMLSANSKRKANDKS